MTILLIQDILDSRARAKKELAFYTGKKTELEKKLNDLRRELNLTDRILKLLEKESCKIDRSVV